VGAVVGAGFQEQDELFGPLQESAEHQDLGGFLQKFFGAVGLQSSLEYPPSQSSFHEHPNNPASHCPKVHPSGPHFCTHPPHVNEPEQNCALAVSTDSPRIRNKKKNAKIMYLR